MDNDSLNLARTISALEAYDVYTGGPHPVTGVEVHVDDDDPMVQALAEGVGVAFGLDTADRNDPETCRHFARPGPWLRSLISKQS